MEFKYSINRDKKKVGKYFLKSNYFCSDEIFLKLLKRIVITKSSYAFYKESALARIDNIKDKKTDWIVIDNSGITISRGFCWDGVTGISDKVCKIRASLIHDALYYAKREGKIDLSLLDVHKIFRNICIEDGTNKFEAYLDFTGLCLFGWAFV